jgi:hypothetical protein
MRTGEGSSYDAVQLRRHPCPQRPRGDDTRGHRPNPAFLLPPSAFQAILTYDAKRHRDLAPGAYLELLPGYWIRAETFAQFALDSRMRYFLPGMSATSEMYAGPWRDLPDSVFLDWPTISGEITFATVAEHFIDKYAIGPSDQLVGTSLGGIVALKIARQSNCNAVILISSATAPSEINSLLMALAPLSSVTPLRFLQHFSAISGEMGQMFSQVDARFIRSACAEP